jgi:hypothetical protein
VAKKEIKETAPLKENLVLVFYTESVFIPESEVNIHCTIKNDANFLCNSSAVFKYFQWKFFQFLIIDTDATFLYTECGGKRIDPLFRSDI